MKYIFIAGAPGSKWSSVARNIYYSPSIDQSDSSDQRQYEQTGHCGAYWDPGMEFDVPPNLNDLSHDHAESIWNAPFSGLGRRIIKSHVFCYRQNIDYLRKNWPSSPIVLVHRSDDSCLGWWVRSGGFSITYPDYVPYYVDLATMASRITEQNKGLLSAWHGYDGQQPETNRQLAELLGLEPPPLIYAQNYAVNDIQVKVI